MSKNSKVPTSSVRIIGGEWRSRRLPVLDAEGLRPSGDRVRETLFNWLQGEVAGTRCLDLFAGSGALGLEALSRGAAFVQFIERDKAVCAQLEKNLKTLQPADARFSLQCSPAEAWIKTSPCQPFDIVFMDPPFSASLWQHCAEGLTHSALLANRALIYVESPRDTKPLLPPNWQLCKSQVAGQVRAELFEYQA